MKIGPYEFPDKCPENCAFNNDPVALSQGGVCHRCPIMNCIPFDTGNGIMACLVDPSEYRSDWALEWHEFFKTGKFPNLKFGVEERKK
jgi:hypothetical protein